jgi:hypothetical protein
MKHRSSVVDRVRFRVNVFNMPLPSNELPVFRRHGTIYIHMCVCIFVLYEWLVEATVEDDVLFWIYLQRIHSHID